MNFKVIFSLFSLIKVCELRCLMYFYNTDNDMFLLCDGGYSILNATTECSRNGYVLAHNLTILERFIKTFS